MYSRLVLVIQNANIYLIVFGNIVIAEELCFLNLYNHMNIVYINLFFPTLYLLHILDIRLIGDAEN